MDDLTYSDAIEKIMLNNGGVATLKQIYEDIWIFKDKSKIKGKTTNNTIQERVQRDERFFRLGLGIYGLVAFKDKLLQETKPKNEQEKQERVHTHLQGMLLEIGNSIHFDTYTNDKRCTFKNVKLSQIATLESLPQFTYKRIIDESARFCDVIWLNNRGFIDSIFEIEITTDFRDAFVKFSEMQDFFINFYCVADEKREEKFIKELAKASFKHMKNRIKFLPNTQIYKEYEMALLRKKSIFS